MAAARIILFRTFIIALAVWVGAGVFSSINEHFAWYSDPVSWVRNAKPRAGTINPWPILTAIVALLTLVSLAVFAFGRGPGRREALFALGATVLVLAATALYFVPRLILIFGKTDSFSDPQIISLSRAWVVWNLARIVYILGVLYYALAAAAKMSRRPDPAT